MIIIVAIARRTHLTGGLRMVCVLTCDDISTEGAGARAFSAMPFCPPGDDATGRGLEACPACPPLMSLSTPMGGS